MCDYRLGEGRSAAPSQTLPHSVCTEQTCVISDPADELQAPSQPFSQSPHRRPGTCPRVTHRPATRTAAAAYRLLHKKSAWLRQDGAVQNYPVASQKLLQGLVPTDPRYVQLYVHQRLRGSICPGRTGEGGDSGGGGEEQSLPCSSGSSCHQPGQDRGNTGSLSQTHKPDKGQICPRRVQNPRGCCRATNHFAVKENCTGATRSQITTRNRGGQPGAGAVLALVRCIGPSGIDWGFPGTFAGCRIGPNAT